MNTAAVEINLIEEFCPTGYQMLESIGEGGFGTVRKARQISTGQMVAIKTLRLREMTEEQRRRQVERFERETAMVAKLHHPHIVKLIDCGHAPDGNPYAIYEYIQGETLKDYILRQGGLSAIEVGELMGHVLDGLSAAHAAGIVHRDLKPQNIMVTRTGARTNASILDFGIGGFTHEVRGLDYRSLTLTQEVLGTPAYTAPEQLRGEGITVKSDLYAWGLIALEALTGKPAVHGNSLAEVMEQQLSPVPIPLPPAVTGHPLAQLLRKVLEKNTRKRAADAASILMEFQRINFSSLVGKIEPHAFVPTTPADAETGLNHFSAATWIAERKQITVLCLKLRLLSANAFTDPEVLDTLLRDQLNLCTDTVTGLGGFVAGSFAGTMLVYFGYPQTSDTDARRAGRAALDLMQQIRRRGAALQEAQGVDMQGTICIHTGSVTVHPAHTPDGLTIIQAKDLMMHAAPGAIVVSEASRKLLEPFLEFDQTRETGSETAYTLIGERQTEALSFLRPSSADRAMVGRTAEKEDIANMWQQVRGGSGKAILVQGQAGIGKSKLAFEAKKLVRAQGYVVREARCLPEHQNNALHAFIDLLRRHFGLQEGGDKTFALTKLESALRQAGMNLEEVMPILGAWFHIALSDAYPASVLPPDKQKLILFEALHKLIGGLGQGNPYLLVIEDLHWLDPTGEEFVNTLVQNAPAGQGLVLMTARPEFQPTWPEDVVAYIALSPLPGDAIRTLVEAVLQGIPIDDQALAYIVQKGDGIPLYIEELTAMLLERELLQEKDGHYHLAEQALDESIPTTLYDLLNARLDRMGTAKETAQLAATIGREFDYELLAKASAREESSIQDDLQALVDADLITQQRRVQGDSYIFRHALIRDAAYEGMGSGVRISFHGRIANAMKTHFPESITERSFELGKHLARAHEFQEASSLGLQAVDGRIKKYANAEAERVSAQVRAWIHLIPEPLLAMKLEIDLNNLENTVFMMTKGTGSQEMYQSVLKNLDLAARIKAHRQAVGLAEDPEIAAIELKTNWGLFSYWISQSNFEEAQKVGEEVLANAIEMGDHQSEMSISGFLGQCYDTMGDKQRAKECFQNVLDKFNTKSDTHIALKFGLDPYLWSLCFMGFAIAWETGFEAGLPYFERAVEYSQVTENPSTISFAFLFMACFLSLIDDRERCRRFMQGVSEEISSIIDNNFSASQYRMVEDWVYGQTERAERLRTTIIDSGQVIALAYYEPSLVKTYLEIGKVQRSMEILSESIDRQIKMGQQAMLPFHYELLMQAHYRHSDGVTAKVLEAFEKSVYYSSIQGYAYLEHRCMNLLAGLYEESGDSEGKEKVLRECKAKFPDQG